MDGVQYVPAGSAQRFGVAVTTYSRPKELAQCLESILEHTPAGTPIVVVDDHGTPPAQVPDGVELIRHPENRGIAAAKNTSLAWLMDAGVDHLFLLDDDTIILDPAIWDAYMQHPEPHLMAQFLDLAGPRKLRDTTILWEDEHTIGYSAARGYFCYYTRHVIDTVGGMDQRAFGRALFEHREHSDRIFQAGLTTVRYGDLRGSEKLVKSLDQYEAVTRSVPQKVRDKLVGKNASEANIRRDAGYVAFVPYRPEKHAVITCLLTAGTDPQRGKPPAAEYASIKTLHESVERHTDAEFILIRDNPVKNLPESVTDVSVRPFSSPYLDRWQHYLQALRDRPDITHAALVDGTDVDLLRDPFPLIPEGKIICGEEHQVTGCEWMRKNHPWKPCQAAIDRHAEEQLLNAGVTIGARADLIDFCHEMVRLISDHALDVFYKRREAGQMFSDMGFYTMTARGKLAARVTHGPAYTTRFKGYEPDSEAFAAVRHK